MFDYVVVGGGSAGCVLAARLSEDPDLTVCLLEAGPADTSEDIRVPAFGGKLFRTELDWDYDTHREPHCDGRRIYLPRGRVLGGSGSMNGMIYIRGHRRDYDDWRQPGWSYHELLPYFLRSEDNERGASSYHGVGGPLSVSDGRSHNPSAAALVAAAAEAGYPTNDDFNGPEQDGFGAYQVTQRDGVRCSSAAGYLHPVSSRPNLTVLTGVTADRLTFDGTRATGVTCRRAGAPLWIGAEREVILTAGAYNTPQLLQLSGVGPADLLTGLDIPVVLDNPEVGGNLQDHPSCWLVFGHSQPVSRHTAGGPESIRLFEQERRGPLTSNGPETGGFLRTRAGAVAPDVQFHSLPFMFLDGGLSAPTGPALSFGSCVLKPQARGSVRLAAADPTAKPKIVHHYYATAADLATAVAGLRISLELSRQPALRPYTERPLAVPESESEADLHRYLRQHTQTLYHPAGTAAIGPVLDTELRVRGLTGVRVADTSVMPTVVRGNTNVPAIVIAEKAADLIRGRTALPAAVI